MYWLSTSSLHYRVLSSRLGPGMGYVWYKNLAVNIGDCVSLVTRMIRLISVPSHLIRDVKEPPA